MEAFGRDYLTNIIKLSKIPKDLDYRRDTNPKVRSRYLRPIRSSIKFFVP